MKQIKIIRSNQNTYIQTNKTLKKEEITDLSTISTITITTFIISIIKYK